MLVKSQHNLTPTEKEAHSVVIEDDMQNPIFVATHIGGGILYASVGDPEFAAALMAAGVKTPAPTVREVLKPREDG